MGYIVGGGASSADMSAINASIAAEATARQNADAALDEKIKEAGYARYEKADSVPTTETAESNVLYLVLNSDTGHYDIYALVGDTVELLDDTTVDLSGYAKTADLKSVSDALTAEAEARETADTEIDGKITTAQTTAETAQAAAETAQATANANKSTLADHEVRITELEGGTDDMTYAKLHQIIQAGEAENYFEVGDIIGVERLSSTSTSIGNSTGITAVTVSDGGTLVKAMGTAETAVYTFTYYSASGWTYDGTPISLSDYGIAVTGTPADGDTAVVYEVAETLNFRVMGFDLRTDDEHPHTVTLEMEDCYSETKVYDAPEALIYISEDDYPDGLPAGTYYIRSVHGRYAEYSSSTNTDEDGIYEFTTTKDIPVGGAIGHTQIGAYRSTGYATDYVVAGTFTTYSSLAGGTNNAAVTLESGIETVLYSDDSSAEYDGEGTYLGTVTTGNPTYREAPDGLSVDNINYTSRCTRGSNRWSQSSVRQWLNSDLIANWWEPKNIFDMRSSDYNQRGFMHGLDPEFIAICADMDRVTTIGYPDYYGTDTKYDTTNDKYYLASRSEYYGGLENSVDEGTPYTYYQQNSTLASAGTSADTARIKYYNGTAQNVWFRSASSTSSNNVRFLHTTGSVYGTLANYGYRVAPACEIW